MEQVLLDPSSVFYFRPGMFIWTLITFGVAVAILWKFAWTPILAAIEKRETVVQQNLESAKKARAEIEKLEIEEKRILAEAHAKARNQVQQQRDAAKAEVEQKLVARRKEIEQERAGFRKELEEAKATARTQFEKDSQALASQIFQTVQTTIGEFSLEADFQKKVLAKYPLD